MNFVNHDKKKIKYKRDYDNFSNSDFPERVEIGTNSVCNARCRICPYPETFKDLPRGDIGDELFRKIIERIKYIIEKLPNSQIIIHTNAGLLTREKSEELVNILRVGDSMNFSFHGGITEESYKREMA